MSDNQLYPPICIPDPTATYCFQVNGYRLAIECGRDAFYDRCYDFEFDETQQGLVEKPEVTGEIHPLQDSFYALNESFRGEYPGWIVTINFQVWPKTELSMKTGSWESRESLAANTLLAYRRSALEADKRQGYISPKQLNEISVLESGGRLWSFCEYGDFGSKNSFLTELTDFLVLTVDIDTVSFWQRKTYPPEGLKDYLKPLFIEYLSRIQIIPTEGVSESELPPLGFYPSEREEKEIDSEGNTVVEDASSTSPSEWGW
ncbi:hypothetical protein [Thalassolituus sp.]|uniref:hypothetical protein n=1 Tax=Thalassolituus sp. TaxID=2030822 RepID=UPI003519463A